jgi:glutathione S-transferase
MKGPATRVARYLWPGMQGRGVSLTIARCDCVAARPRIAAYLKSKRRRSFNQMGIVRPYRELDPPSRHARPQR